MEINTVPFPWICITDVEVKSYVAPFEYARAPLAPRVEVPVPPYKGAITLPCQTPESIVPKLDEPDTVSDEMLVVAIVVVAVKIFCPVMVWSLAR